VKVPSLMAKHSKDPTLNRYLSSTMFFLIFRFIVDLILRVCANNIAAVYIPIQKNPSNSCAGMRFASVYRLRSVSEWGK